jgi:hypothetical protein
MRRLRKYLALAPAARAMVLRSLLLLPVVALLLRARGMERTRAWLGRLGSLATGDASALSPRDIAILVGAAASLLQSRCLPRSLLLWHFLRDRGASAEIRLGVTKLADGNLSAHAWVEFDGLPLNDGPDVLERYEALPSRTCKFATSQPKTLSF